MKNGSRVHCWSSRLSVTEGLGGFAHPFDDLHAEGAAGFAGAAFHAVGGVPVEGLVMLPDRLGDAAFRNGEVVELVDIGNQSSQTEQRWLWR